MKTFRESLKQEIKLLKQEVDLLPKSERKETLKARKEALEGDQNHREQLFLAKLNDTHESSLKRLSDTHREKIALLDRQFLQQKQQLMRAREAAIWVSFLKDKIMLNSQTKLDRLHSSWLLSPSIYLYFEPLIMKHWPWMEELFKKFQNAIFFKISKILSMYSNMSRNLQSFF